MIHIIYWSGSGNTEKMANSIADGVRAEGEEVKVIEVSSATVDDVKNVDKVAFGCPAMGAEELEESTMRPFMDSVNPLLGGKKIVIFGSYEWADGQWIRDWQEEVESFGGILVDDPLAVYDHPKEDDVDECERVGKALVRA
ncbi:flavodoxin [Peptoniphilus sp. KCTC 25270]|uniref:flavodoxin n=1 Tax=Peptoniphilus sp. KCTC 25270 TaxID=2897414 RepID=UPI001E3A90AB|nr:flavodoxin [Peptoniphilus sp. KCTC 25270]MCD1147896.1 flavodoxin [Peptoniphilus sp. KCTC 25270]